MYVDYELRVCGEPGNESPTLLKVEINAEYEEAQVLLAVIRHAVAVVSESCD